jgi:peptide/nickel transport system substrate-binding protein
MRFGRGKAGATILAIGTITILAACSSSSSSSGAAPSTGSVKTGGSLTFAMDEDLAGFNINQADDNEFVLQEVMDQVWPQTFIIPPSLDPTLDPDYVTSATLSSTSPQTVVYKINPKATWSDGVPINAADFVYNWESQSGDPKYTDVGKKAYIPASTSGYNQIKSVTGSNNGKTVTVVFSSPYSDWKALFTDLIPAHIAEKVGFNSGFQNFGAAVKVSGGPYEIQSYTQGEDLVEVRNPHWWGTPGKLSKIVFRFITDDSQIPPAISNNEVQLTNPALASVAFDDAVKGITNTTTDVIPGLEFQHIDFNEANYYLAQVKIRQAIADGTNRAQMVQRIVAPLTTKIPPLGNRMFMPNQSEFQNTSGSNGNFSVSAAKALLQSSGMTMGSDGYFHPSAGPEAGKDLSFNISTTSGVPVRAEIEQLFQADMKAIGVKLNIQNYAAATLFGTVGPKSEYDMIEFAWVSTPFASGNQPIYCSYTNTAVCGENWNHYANKTVDSLFVKALATLNPTAAAAIYNQIDTILWQDMVTLPLFQQPQLYTWSNTYGNISPNASNVGIPWNAQKWGLKA